MIQNQAEIEAGQLVVFFVDECHLLGDDVCGYVWGKTDIRIEIPIKNIKDRQTFFEALDYQTKEFIDREYPVRNSSSTIEVIKYLQSQRLKQRIGLIGDGAKYHNTDETKEFLAAVNDDCEPERWSITCSLFGPNASEQNPVENVWLKTKKFLRKYWHLCNFYAVVKWLFNFFTNYQKFDLPKVHQYVTYL